ncbi:MAG: type I-C CRISPR-associated endonuclease Cas1 [Alicyclobacillaceae bacterium]|nr:type I-C CRISPR-associated endonuclease Cas1 [Alicyclobacillaceae bacterium]
MSEALNTLYVQTDGAVLRLDHDNVVVTREKDVLMRVPLHHLQAIVAIGRVSITSPLLSRCAEDGRAVIHLDSQGKFMYRLEGRRSGNVLLRVAQHQVARTPERAIPIVRAVVAGKLHNCRQVLLRAARESELPDGRESLRRAAEEMAADLRRLRFIGDLEALRGMEGINSKRYFSQIPHLLKVGDFTFSGRVRRPPRDPVNALLSFLYTLLVHDVVSALEAVGLDPQVGYLHALRPGRPSLALDLMEELRPVLADRTAFTLLNRRQIGPDDFEEWPGGAVLLNDRGRKTVVEEYQKRKQDVCRHPLLRRRVTFAVVMHIQARLLARAVRSEVPYIPFLYK